jgi:phage protein U
MIGYLGDIVFETSDQRILTFADFKHDITARWESHAIIGQKPRLEFIGAELETVSFTILFKADLGVKPSEELQKLREKIQNGKAELLVIGGIPLGDDLWVIESMSESWNCLWNEGQLYSASGDITMKEYISGM